MVDLPFDIAFDAVAGEMLRIAMAILAPILIMVVAVGVFADMLQVGVNFAFEAVKPSGKKLNVAANAKNLFSKKNLIEFLKNIAKVTFLSVLIFLVVRGSLDTLIKVPPGGVGAIVQALAGWSSRSWATPPSPTSSSRRSTSPSSASSTPSS